MNLMQHEYHDLQYYIYAWCSPQAILGILERYPFNSEGLSADMSSQV